MSSFKLHVNMARTFLVLSWLSAHRMQRELTLVHLARPYFLTVEKVDSLKSQSPKWTVIPSKRVVAFKFNWIACSIYHTALNFTPPAPLYHPRAATRRTSDVDRHVLEVSRWHRRHSSIGWSAIISSATQGANSSASTTRASLTLQRTQRLAAHWGTKTKHFDCSTTIFTCGCMPRWSISSRLANKDQVIRLEVSRSNTRKPIQLCAFNVAFMIIKEGYR